MPEELNDDSLLDELCQEHEAYAILMQDNLEHGLERIGAWR